jgi:hypothetical protein
VSTGSIANRPELVGCLTIQVWPSLRKDERAPIKVIALSPTVLFHVGKVKSSTSALTRSF